MSFHYVLQSNTSPNTFPNNNGSEFSTPVDNPIMLENKWEMALMSLTHSNCINTFDNEHMTLTQKTGDLQDIVRPTRISIRSPDTTERSKVISFYQQTFKDLFEDGVVLDYSFVKSRAYVTLTVKRKDIFLILSDNLAKTLRLPSEVVSPYDTSPSNVEYLMEKLFVHETSIIVVPMAWKQTKISIKASGETASATLLSERFREKVPSDICRVFLTNNSKSVKLRLMKDEPSGTVVMFSHLFHKAMGLPQRAKYSGYNYRWLDGLSDAQYHTKVESEWFLTLYTIDEIFPHESSLLTSSMLLKPCRLTSSDQVVALLNKEIDGRGVVFSQDNDKLKMEIKNRGTSIHFTDTLRDILALDKNTFTGKGTYEATGSISLTRRIRYFYIYSDIGDMVRIGNMEAPLLAVIPFQPKSCRVLTEKTFRTPMYVPVKRNYISQIDIAIMDDAGCRIPFTDDSATSLRLHFRQV